MGPISLTGSGPSLAAFFVFYGPIKDEMGGGPLGVATASLLAGVPATLVGTKSNISQDPYANAKPHTR
eukprot:8926891-Pyramimonas_sp.AAC.1